MQRVLEREVQVAKLALKSGNKQTALLALKKKRYQEQLISKTENQLHTLEELTLAIEYALVEQQVMKGLESGNQVLKSIHAEMSLENVDKLMDETADAIAYQAEIDAALSGSLNQEDQDAIMAELDALVELEVILIRFNLMYIRKRARCRRFLMTMSWINLSPKPKSLNFQRYPTTFLQTKKKYPLRQRKDSITPCLLHKSIVIRIVFAILHTLHLWFRHLTDASFEWLREHHLAGQVLELVRLFRQFQYIWINLLEANPCSSS